MKACNCYIQCNACAVLHTCQMQIKVAHLLTRFSLSLSQPSVTTHLKFFNRAISITAPCLWNDLPHELRTFSFPPPSLKMNNHHLSLAPLSITPRVFHSKLKCHLFKNSYPDSFDPLSFHYPLNYTQLNSYSASSYPLATGPKPPMGYPLDNPSDRTQHS